MLPGPRALLFKGRCGGYCFGSLNFVRREVDGERLGVGPGLPHRECLFQSWFLRALSDVARSWDLDIPGWTPLGSALVPKLIGSYECELHALVEQLCRIQYSQVVDVGCAEGYYAVGFAMRMPGSKVFKRLIATIERGNFCREMADFNGVSDRVYVSGKCTSEDLIRLLVQGRGLVFSGL